MAALSKAASLPSHQHSQKKVSIRNSIKDEISLSVTSCFACESVILRRVWGELEIPAIVDALLAGAEQRCKPLFRIRGSRNEVNRLTCARHDTSTPLAHKCVAFDDVPPIACHPIGFAGIKGSLNIEGGGLPAGSGASKRRDENQTIKVVFQRPPSNFVGRERATGPRDITVGKTLARWRAAQIIGTPLR